jgi:pimeloyl-ACP methyl ester carboxylesterase
VPSSTADVVILVPGATYAHVYWDLPYRQDVYSLTRWLNRAGFDTLALDRIGTGGSDRPPTPVVTLPANAFVLHQIVQHLRHRWARVFIVGHSMGSLISVLEAATYNDVDGVVVTGVLHTQDAQSKFIRHFHSAADDHRFADDPPPDGYMTSRPGGRLACFYWKDTVEDTVLRLDEATKDTVTAGELASIDLARQSSVSGAVSSPVLVIVGQRDITASSDPITADGAAMAAERGFYDGARTYDAAVIPETGHNICLHTTAPMQHAIIVDWLSNVS